MFNYNWQRRIVAATPLLALITWLLLGYLGNYWHPGWLVFLAIPLMPFLVGLKQFRLSISIFILIIYVILGVFDNGWHPWWILFLFIPVYHILFIPVKKTEVKVYRPTKNNDSTVDMEIDEE